MPEEQLHINNEHKGEKDMHRKNAWEQYDAAQAAELEAFATDYKRFLDGGKT